MHLNFKLRGFNGKQFFENIEHNLALKLFSMPAIWFLNQLSNFGMIQFD